MALVPDSLRRNWEFHNFPLHHPAISAHLPRLLCVPAPRKLSSCSLGPAPSPSLKFPTASDTLISFCTVSFPVFAGCLPPVVKHYFLKLKETNPDSHLTPLLQQLSNFVFFTVKILRRGVQTCCFWFQTSHSPWTCSRPAFTRLSRGLMMPSMLVNLTFNLHLS